MCETGLKFEEGVSGRIKSSNDVRWEYAKVFWDKTLGRLSYLGVEGAERAGALMLNIDRMLGFVKAGKTDEVLRLLDRIAMFLENPKNVNERWVLEFPAGKIEGRPDLLAQRQANEILEKIRNGATDALRFGEESLNPRLSISPEPDPEGCRFRQQFLMDTIGNSQ